MRDIKIITVLILSLILSSCSWGLYPFTCSPTWFTNCGNRPEKEKEGEKKKEEKKEKGKEHEPEIKSEKTPG